MPEQEAANLNPKVEQIMGQYRRVVGALDVMFREISARTMFEEWRFNGFGSCGVPKYGAELKIHGIAKDDLIALREERNSLDHQETIETDGVICPYHRKDFGCVLGDLKGPVCISFIENKNEVEAWFGIDQIVLSRSIQRALARILVSHISDESQVDPRSNEQFVEEEIAGIERLTEYIRSFPVIEEARVDFAQGSRQGLGVFDPST